MLNKSTGNMYPFVTHTWNPVQGRCPHACSYCYMRKIWNLQDSKEQIFKDNYLHDDLGEGRTIFVGSSTDMWLGEPAWISQILNHCRAYPDNAYLLQTKNPEKMMGWVFPPDTIIGVTLETDNYRLCQHVSNAPPPGERVAAMAYLRRWQDLRTMVSIEPIMDFNIPRFVHFIQIIEPEFVSIGADSKRPGNPQSKEMIYHDFPEPPAIAVEFLIKELRKFTEVRIKPNLSRIYGGRESI
jgi:DNA repair photolyase